MNAPDKIWLYSENGVSIDNDWLLGPTKVFEDIEYVRKDTLLEWVKNMKRICKGAESIEKAYQTVIDKIESL